MKEVKNFKHSALRMSTDILINEKDVDTSKHRLRIW